MSDNTIVISQITDVDDELNLKHFIVSSYEDFCFQHKNHYQFLLETGVFFNSNFPNPENIRARYWVYKNISDAESVDIEDLWHENKNSLLFAYEQLFDVSNLEKYPGFEPGDPFPLEDFYEIMDKKVIQSWRLDKHLQIDEEFEGLSYPEEVFSLLVKIYIEKANDSPQRVTSMSDITFVYDNGTYSGDELNGDRHGFGIYYYSNGDIYEGEWKNNFQNGKGIYKYGPKSDWAGDEYNGTFKDDLFAGNGTYTWKDGAKYIGNWKNNLFHGQGIHTLSDGYEYNGGFEGGKKSGYGTYKYISGDIYEGEWKNDQENGQGILSYSSGDKYNGAFEDGNISGYGTYKWVYGDKYIGDWKNNLHNGYGTYTYNNGEVKCGEWKDNELIEEDNSLKKVIPEMKEMEDNNKQKTIVIKQEIHDSLNGGPTYDSKNFIVSSFDDLQNQLKNHFVSLLESGFLNSILDNVNSDKNVAIHAETDQEISTCLYAYKNLTDAENDKYRLWFVKEGGFFPPDQLYFSSDDEQWNNVSEYFSDSAYDAWGLDKLISNPPKKLTEAWNDKYLRVLFEIYKKAAHGENWENEEQIKESESPKTLTAETKEVENINIESKERVNNNNREKTITVQQIIYNSTKGGQLNYGMKYFHAASFEDLKIQLIDHYVHLLETGSLASKSMESGQNNIAVDRESGQDVEANLKAYKKIFDVEKNEYRNVTLPLCNSIFFYPPNEIAFTGVEWDAYLDIEDNDFEFFGLNDFKSNYQKKFEGVYDEEFLTLLFEIYKKAAHDENWEKEEQIKESESPKKLTAETKEIENINISSAKLANKMKLLFKEKTMGFQWEKIYNTEEMIGLQAREQVFNYVFQYYNVEDVDDLTKKQINEIIKFRDQELSEFSNLKSGFNDLIGMWES